MKTVFPHPGSKRRLLPKILPLLPEHRVYVEPFAGALAVFLGKERSPLEVINDADGDLVSLYRYAKWHPEALVAELNKHLNSRSEFEALKRNPGFTDLQRAARYFILKVCSFGGQSGHYGRNPGGFKGYREDYHAPLLRELSERLRGVQIECGDWEKVVAFYDSPEALHYFDPPYVACAETSYAPFTEADMARIRARLGTLEGKWILSCDDSPACRRVFAGLPARRLAIKYTLAAAGAAKESYELLVLHPDIAAAHPERVFVVGEAGAEHAA